MTSHENSCDTFASNPLLLAQVRPQLEATFSRHAGGASLLQTLFANVRTALLHGIQLVFLWSAIVMTVAIVLNVLLKNVPLRHSHAPVPEAQTTHTVKSPEWDLH